MLLFEWQQPLLQANVVEPMLTFHFVDICFAQQGKLDYLVKEEAEECAHPCPEPDTSLLKNKVNHKCVVALFKEKQ